MKIFWLTLSILLFTNAKAVNPSHCPRTLKFMAGITKLYQLDSSSLPTDHLQKAKKNQEELSWEPTLDMNFNISFASSGACYYEGRDFSGVPYQAKIEQSLKGLHLFIFSDDTAIDIELSEVSASGIKSKRNGTEFNYRQKICGANRCRSKNYPIAFAEIDDIH